MLVAIPAGLQTHGCVGGRRNGELRLAQGVGMCTARNTAPTSRISTTTRRCTARCATTTRPTEFRTSQRRSTLCQARRGNVVSIPIGLGNITMSRSRSFVVPVGRQQIGKQIVSMPREMKHGFQGPWEFAPCGSIQCRPALPDGLRPCRILCYGDSNTAGFTHGGRTYAPYGESLAEALHAGGAACDVGICGLNGHTAEKMISQLVESNITDGHNRKGKGLTCILDEDGPIDLVIIMVGTNDLGRGAHPMDIATDVASLHSACHQRGVPTIAIAPPFGASKNRITNGALLRRRMTELLPGYLEGKEGLLAYFDAEELVPHGCSECWSDDIHFTPAGSHMLGLRLAEWLLPVLQAAQLEGGVPIDPEDMLLPVYNGPLSQLPLSPLGGKARSVSPPPGQPVCVTHSLEASLLTEELRELKLDRVSQSRSMSADAQEEVRQLHPSRVSQQRSCSVEADRERWLTRSASPSVRTAKEHAHDEVPFRSFRADPGPPVSPGTQLRSIVDVKLDVSTFRDGDSVEVWSNSQQVWCPGKVKKVVGSKLTTEFVLPDRSSAKKVLAMKSCELRHA